METESGRKTKWRLKKISKYWFLVVSGDLIQLEFLNNASEVFLEENLIIANEIIYQLKEDSNGKVIITRVKSIIQKGEISAGGKHGILNLQSEKTEESGTKNRDEIESQIKLETLTEAVSLSNISLMEEKEELSIVAEDYMLDNEQDSENHDIGSEEYRKKRGKIRAFINHIKKIVTKKPIENKAENPYLDIAINSSELFENECNYESIEVRQDTRSEADRGTEIGTAIFEYEKFSDEETSFKRMDKLKICDVMSDNSDWCYAENLSTDEKGFIPLPYVRQDEKTLTSMGWWHDVNRYTANEMMKTLDTSDVGTFLIRPSYGEHKFALSVLMPGSSPNETKVAHLRIYSENSQLFFNKGAKAFNDIFSLVDYYERKLMYPFPKQRPFIYPRNVKVAKMSIDFGKSFQVGNFGELFNGKLFKTLDVTVVTKCKSEPDLFLAEANILFKFRQSKHFVKMIAVVLEPEEFMIVLGETVHDTLQNLLRTFAENKDDVPSFEVMTDMASEIAGGMAFLEEKGIVHGNLKAENVFICGVSDLKIIHPRLIQLMATSDNTKLAKDEHDWQWTAPEVIADENALSTKSDVWSFGVLLYEVITFGEMPYKGMEKEKTLRGLSEGLRIPIPKGGLIHCPVEFYMTMLQCWHKNPERRLTFDFLCDLLFSFRNAVESEPYFKDDTHKFKYMTGTLQNEQGRTKESNESVQQTTVHDQSVVMYEKQMDECPSETMSSTDNIERSDQIVQDNNSRISLNPGFNVIALYDFEAAADDEISFNKDDIITNIDPIDEGWWIGTTKNGVRGIFPANYVKIYENAYAEMTKQKQMDECPFETMSSTDNIERSDQIVQDNNSRISLNPGFNVIALYDFEAAADDEISFNKDDIITNIDPEEKGWWIGTKKNGVRGLFPVNYVEVFENAYARVNKL